MTKELLLLFGTILIVSYLIFAFVNWDIVWVTSVDAVMRVTFVLFMLLYAVYQFLLIWRVKINIKD